MDTLYATGIGGNDVYRLFDWSNLRVLPDITLAEGWPRSVVIFVYDLKNLCFDEKDEHTQLLSKKNN
jgi:hypothetical protein